MRGLELNRPCFEPCAVCTDLSFGLGPVLDLAEARHEGLGFELIGSIARGEAGHPVDLELCGKTCVDMAIGFEHWSGGAEWVRCDHGAAAAGVVPGLDAGVRARGSDIHEAARPGGAVTERVTV